jgi:hypothetical protein
VRRPLLVIILLLSACGTEAPVAAPPPTAPRDLVREALHLVGAGDDRVLLVGTAFRREDGTAAFCPPGGPESADPRSCLGVTSLELADIPAGLGDEPDGQAVVIEGRFVPAPGAAVYPWAIANPVLVDTPPPVVECRYEARADGPARLRREPRVNRRLRDATDETSTTPLFEILLRTSGLTYVIAGSGDQDAADALAELFGGPVTLVTMGVPAGGC